MNGRFRMKTVDKSDIVRPLAQIGEQIGNHVPALAARFERPLGSYSAPFIAVTATSEGLDRNCFAIQRIKFRFVVECINVAWPAIHEQKDDSLGLGRSHRRLGFHRVRPGGSICCARLAAEEVVSKHASKGSSRKTSTCLPQHFAAGAATELAFIRHCRHSLVEINEFAGVESQQAVLTQGFRGRCSRSHDRFHEGNVGIQFGAGWSAACG